MPAVKRNCFYGLSSYMLSLTKSWSMAGPLHVMIIYSIALPEIMQLLTRTHTCAYTHTHNTHAPSHTNVLRREKFKEKVETNWSEFTMAVAGEDVEDSVADVVVVVVIIVVVVVVSADEVVIPGSWLARGTVYT